MRDEQQRALEARVAPRRLALGRRQRRGLGGQRDRAAQVLGGELAVEVHLRRRSTRASAARPCALGIACRRPAWRCACSARAASRPRPGPSARPGSSRRSRCATSAQRSSRRAVLRSAARTCQASVSSDQAPARAWRRRFAHAAPRRAGSSAAASGSSFCAACLPAAAQARPPGRSGRPLCQRSVELAGGGVGVVAGQAHQRQRGQLGRCAVAARGLAVQVARRVLEQLGHRRGRGRADQRRRGARRTRPVGFDRQPRLLPDVGVATAALPRYSVLASRLQPSSSSRCANQAARAASRTSLPSRCCVSSAIAGDLAVVVHAKARVVAR